MDTKLLLSGIALRPAHYEQLLEQKPPLAWIEAPGEQFFTDNEPALETLRSARELYPVSLHCSGLSIGSADELNWHYLKRLRDLIDVIDPCMVSDHLAWSSINGHYLHSFLPLPYTEETLDHVSTRLQQVQDYLGRQLLIKNVACYSQFNHNDMPEWDFIQTVASRSGCGILLDVNNIYINAHNLNFNPVTYLQALHPDSVQQYHLSGFRVKQTNQHDVLIDSHDRAIIPAVFDLFSQTVAELGIKGTIVEWDRDLPSLQTLCLQAYRADKIMRDVYATRKLAV